MIIWFNCKITDQRLNPQSIIRYNLRDDNRFDIAKYSFASFAPLEPLTSKFIFNLELADSHSGRQEEMETWLRGIFPADKLSIHWYRANNIAQWQEIKQEIDQIGDDLIFPAGNEDHIFLDSNIEVFKRGLELIKQDPYPYATLMTSHYPESIRAAHYFKGTPSSCGNYVSYEMVNNDAIRVIKKEYFEWYLDTAKNSNALLFRTEHWNNIGILSNKLYVPTKEQFRHFDGYAHVQVGADTCPPLEIPAGFFDGMTIRYGHNDRQSDAVNINPMAEQLYTVDHEKGADYRYTLDELPLFWKPYIKQTDISPDIDQSKMNQAYDTHLLQMTRVNVNWFHVGARFNESNYPPASWINNHTKEYLFYE